MEPVDMRKGFDGLSALIQAAKHPLYSGALFVFLSKRRDRAKILSYHQGGMVLWYKRLDRGRFRLQKHREQPIVELDSTSLTMLLDGIDLDTVRRPAYWMPNWKKEDRQSEQSMIYKDR